MPEQYWPKRKGSHRLSDAERNDRYAQVTCTYCKRRRYFPLADLRVAFGDIECDDVIHVARWRCSGCDGKGSLDFKLGDPPGDQADRVMVRRLDRVFYVRRLVWKDKTGA